MALTQEQIRALENIRQRLQGCSAAIGSAHAQLEQTQPLPSWPNFLAQQNRISQSLGGVQELLSQHHAFWTSLHAYPATNYPALTQQGPLEMLLRKKLEPETEDWVLQHAKQPETQVNGHKVNGAMDVDGVDDSTRYRSIETEDVKELWNWAGATTAQILETYKIRNEDGEVKEDIMDDVFTIEERKAGAKMVRTGLRRRLYDTDEEDEGDDDDDDEKMGEDIMPAKPTADVEKLKGVDPSLPPMKLETMLRFVHTGHLPPQR